MGLDHDNQQVYCPGCEFEDEPIVCMSCFIDWDVPQEVPCCYAADQNAANRVVIGLEKRGIRTGLKYQLGKD